MQDVIHEVLAAEKKAAAMVQSVRAEADQMLGQARGRSREILKQAQEGARGEHEAILEAAASEAQNKKAGRLKQADAEIQLGVQLHLTTARRIVDAAVDCILGRAADGRIQP